MSFFLLKMCVVPGIAQHYVTVTIIMTEWCNMKRSNKTWYNLKIVTIIRLEVTKNKWHYEAAMENVTVVKM